MKRRKGESYLGGHTVITLRPSLVEAGLIEQAAEHKRQARDDQERFDATRAKLAIIADQREYESRSPERRARGNAESDYRNRLYQIERVLMTNPHPRIKTGLLIQQLSLLERLREMISGAGLNTRKITQRIYHARRALERLP